MPLPHLTQNRAASQNTRQMMTPSLEMAKTTPTKTVPQKTDAWFSSLLFPSPLWGEGVGWKIIWEHFNPLNLGFSNQLDLLHQLRGLWGAEAFHCGSRFFPAALWILGTKSESSNLMTNALICGVISLVPSNSSPLLPHFKSHSQNTWVSN